MCGRMDASVALREVVRRAFDPTAARLRLRTCLIVERRERNDYYREELRALLALGYPEAEARQLATEYADQMTRRGDASPSALGGVG